MENSKRPLISVIVPCYNYGNLLSDCIGSLFSQSYQNWECIVVDDGSKDTTRLVVEERIKMDKRIHYFYQDNLGPAAARNLGLSKAKGEFIQFIDADDLIENRKFEKQMELFSKDPGCDIVYSNVKYFREGDRTKLYDDITLEGSSPWMKKLSGRGEVMIGALLSGNIMVINSPLVRRSLFENLGDMSNDLSYNEDWELWTRFAIGNAKFQFAEDPGTLALVRVHDSYSKDNFKMYVFGLLACLKLNNMIRDRKYKKILIPRINYHKRIIDEKLIEMLKTDRKKAIEWTLFISILTNISRYSCYTKLFRFFPVWLCYVYSKVVFLIYKLKNTVVYA